MKNKPGIPNEGDTVKVVEIGEMDSYPAESKNLGQVGIARDVDADFHEDNFISLNLDNEGGVEINCFFHVKVKILKRRKDDKE
ncbi:hypothetical protein LCGC14_0395650 [marine sediment metagenome]|uniref:DUF4926 domain-containing protein n=1 Tax=marine sediment metagenome TaxID=412755 RepID=A0A0F9T476_9ZZZZ